MLGASSFDSFAVQARSRYVGGMQGKLAIAIVMAAFGADAALCGEAVRRQPCQKSEQAQQQQRQQPQPQQQPQRKQPPQGCQIQRIPPVVDPTPVFLL